jgi:hypothetical protein
MLRSCSLERKNLLFVNKKKQKNFMTLDRGVAAPGAKMAKVFLVLFLQKKNSFLA